MRSITSWAGDRRVLGFVSLQTRFLAINLLLVAIDALLIKAAVSFQSWQQFLSIFSTFNLSI
jgi:hypothetical protein